METRIKDKMNKLASSITITVTVIIEILWMNYVPIKPEWLKHIVGAVISLLMSIGVVYGVCKKIIFEIWKKKNKNVYIGGVWYVVYSGESYKKDHYLRIGSLKIDQYYDEIEMSQMVGHTPKVENGVVDMTGYQDATIGERPSTGAGHYILDKATASIVGEYGLQRQEPHHIKVNGFSQGTISVKDGVPTEVRGEFFNGEFGRSNGRPTWGRICMFKQKEDWQNECQRIINE